MNYETSENGEPGAPAFREAASPKGLQGPARLNGTRVAAAVGPGAAGPGATDLLPLLDVVLRRWFWLVLAGAALGALGFEGGMRFWHDSWTAPAQLLRYDSPNAAEVFGQRQASPQTLPSLLHSPDLLQRVGSKARPPVAPDVLSTRLRVMPEHDSDIIVATITGQKPQPTVDLANLYVREAVEFTRQLQARAANDVVAFTSNQLEQVESQIAEANREAASLAVQGPATNAASRPSAISEQLQTARAELYGLLSQYTEAHPLVQKKRAQIAALEKELGPTPTEQGGATNSPAAQLGHALQVVQAKIQVLETARLALLGRRQAAEALAAEPPGYCQVLATAAADNLVKHGRVAKVVLLTTFLGLLGLLISGAAVLSLEVMDNRLKSAADVKRVTGLPLLASAGDLQRMSPVQKERWAFRAWTSLQGRLSPSPNHGLVCGITSAGHGEGRSTWLNLLAGIANQQGFRVLTITTRPTARNGDHGRTQAEGPSAAGHSATAGGGEVATLAANLLATPAEVARKLMGTEPQPIVQIPLPGWVWNLERRKQWQAALRHWSQIENVVILVELPPASEPEAVLLAENLPNVVWLVAGGRADAGTTREELETLRHARCRLAGSVLNRARNSFVQRRFPRWLACAGVVAVLSAFGLQAADNPGVDAETKTATSLLEETRTNLSFAVLASTPRASWQKHLALGPGDVLTFALYGEPTLTQLSVPIGPDGRVSYLEAQDVPAAGLTVDDLRTRMDVELAKYRRAPHTMITPVAFNSKKYFLLGSVVDNGVFTLDRPLTVVEAVARAHGLQTALQQRNLVEIADLQRAFLVRDGKRLPVDFEKLFARGDLSQNVALAPDDYLYFPPADLKEVYVVGEVAMPGVVPWTADVTALRAIAERRGFTDRAWKKKVLVVRGSLSSPRGFEVNASDVLAARTPDFKLEPGDIVYIHPRPWARVEELLDYAATAFVQAAVIVWTGLHAGPLITTPVIH